ncbi:MAG: hypothetical protein E6I93_05730 [Chloroflexi bacterium]|nr:MAG: hypothetical protein E6I93_05730 [Chloroflexota bacterium]TMF47997.1 MAG: hypothetical protein E6I32_08525 [Chloroflexota bacterium]
MAGEAARTEPVELCKCFYDGLVKPMKQAAAPGNERDFFGKRAQDRLGDDGVFFLRLASRE